MHGIPREVIEQKLDIDHHTSRSNKKKEDTLQRGAKPSNRKSIHCSKLCSSGVSYPSYLANLVLVEKFDDSWRMCIDYTSLNKACLKDEYHMPHICRIIDSTSSCELLSFLDV
jgi:hypothetical protein